MKASRAYGHARMRACRSRLLTRASAAQLFTATDAASMQRVLSALGIDEPSARLWRVYDTAIRGYPRAAALFLALRRLHDIEDVKLQWRRRRPPPHELAQQLANTPFHAIASTVARAHGTDVAAAELAFDRWASQCVLDEARRLPRREALARELVELFVEERDAQLALRGARWYGLASVTGQAVDIVALRKQRLRLCRRAFIGSPFLLATPVAVILLAEEELRAVRALVERQGDQSLDAPMLRAIAGSEIGG